MEDAKIYPKIKKPSKVVSRRIKNGKKADKCDVDSSSQSSMKTVMLRSNKPMTSSDVISPSKSKIMLKTLEFFTFKDQEVDLMASMMFEEIPTSRKIIILLKNFFLPHLIACILNTFLMIIQHSLNRSCYLNGVCNCNNDFNIKVYNYIKEFVSIWFFILYLSYIPIFHVKLMRKKSLFKTIFWIFQVCNFAFFYMRSNGDEDFGTNVVQYCLYAGVGSNFLFQIYYLCKLKFNFKIFFRNCMKGAPSMPIAANDFINIMLFGFIRSFLSNNFSENSSNNIMDLLIMIYLQILRFVLNKTVWFQFEALSAEDEELNELHSAVTFSIRYCCCHVVAINILAIARRNPTQWGSWVLILSYLLFLVKSYSRTDFLKLLWNKLYEMFYPLVQRKKTTKKKTTTENSNFFKFQKIYSGCMLDVQFIFCIRFIIMYLSKRWSANRGYAIYYQNCQYEISEKFLVNYWSVLGIFLLNVFILAFIFGSMVIKKSIIFSYLKSRKPWLNIYILFGIHCVLEIDLQQYCFALFDAN